MQYVDFALWQRSWLQGDRSWSGSCAYWREQLEATRDAAAADRSAAPCTGELQGCGASLQFSPDSSQQLTELGRREGVTLYMVLLAAYQALLCRSNT